MSLTWILYLSDFIQSIACITGFIVIIYVICIGIMCIGWGLTNDRYSADFHAQIEKGLKYVSGKWYVLFLSLLINILIPSKTTMYLMMGSSYLSQSNIPLKVSKILELKLDDVLKELQDKDKK